MPVHDWTRVDAGLFHDFHQSWMVALRNALNGGGLPRDYFALVEQRISDPIASGGPVGLAVATAPPRTRLTRRREAQSYARKADHIIVRHRHGEVVAVIEIVSPGNKAGRAEFRQFIQKTVELFLNGVHLLVIDLFPPGPRDPFGIHKAIWDEFEDEEFELPADKPLVLAAYDAGPSQVAYVQSIAVGDVLPEMPIFLEPEFYVPAPLEATYLTTWSFFPAPLKKLLEAPSPEPPPKP